jgi:N-acetylneuraminate synthase/N,N'-diacetyllegionaminate synthase
MPHHEILIGDRVIGGGSTVFVVAEIGINHGGSLPHAMRLIDAAAEAGADAVKFQTFRADRLMVSNGDRLAQQDDGSESAYQMFRRLELGGEEYEKLKRHADARKVLFLSTPFDEESADLLDGIGVPAFKVASADINHLPLLKHLAAKKKPVILSTGMSFLSEVAEAVWTLKTAGTSEILLLHCVSSYPAPPESLNLRSIQTMRDYFDLPVGYSDHAEGILLPLVAVSLGAVLVEKHFTLDKHAPGPDHKLSVDPGELRSMVQSIRIIEASLGDGRKCPAPCEAENRLLSRRSIVACADIRAHETIALWMLSFKRPGNGIEPKQAEKIVGMKARRNISRDTALQWDDLSPSLGHERDEGGNLVEQLNHPYAR